MRVRRRSPPPTRRLPHSPTSSWPSSPSRKETSLHPSKRRRTAHGIAIFLLCSLACAWSAGVVIFFAALQSNAAPQTIINDNSLASKFLRNRISNSKSDVKRLPRTVDDTRHFQLMTQTSNKDEKASWSWPIIHIVSTRFMQGQGNLVSLARSRLKLLEVICLPSMMKQTLFDGETLRSIYNHTKWAGRVESLTDLDGSEVDPLLLWVIKVDPNIDKAVLNELRAVLEPVKRFTIVVGSNTNYGIGVKTGGWRDGKEGNNILEAFRNDKIYFPSDKEYAFGIVSRAHEARSDRVVLETRLDSDDAINISYFSVLHYTALKDLVNYSISEFVSNDDEFEQKTDDEHSVEVQHTTQHPTARWIYWCPHRHIQWNPSTSFYNPNNDPGMLSVFESPNVCVTPGLTLGFAVGTDEADVPRYEHTQVYWEINHNHNFKTGDSTEQDCGLYPTSRCAVFVENPYVAAFRSRAMTSAGMHMMEALGKPSMEMPDFYTEISNKLWKGHIQDYFGIEPKKAKEAADFLMNIYVDTVRDNLRGQCTKGHSCKQSSLEKLLRTIDILEEESGGIDVLGSSH
ncbi:hypothetical protein HJC23_012477 [Cyclotella cryptica]|uniref:Uncharacterized protein n=1 Tax=Cyclotella cryptica TaxID=29204 RepID=A0ABD3PAW9_9STRA|eukprot:CCRYP_016272-RA/>CCRYP_016272-RA protein AED:0.02 eAED:0.02 QI:262/1/1/1/1/1/2/319/569